MVHTWEKLTNIRTPDVFVMSHKILTAVKRAMCSFTDAVGIGILNKTLFKQWFYDAAKCMMYKLIPEARSADETSLGLMDVKRMITTRLVSIALQQIDNREQVCIQVMLKLSDFRTASFTQRRAFEGLKHILPAGQPSE